MISGTSNDPAFSNMSDADILKTFMKNIKSMCENANFPVESIHLTVSSTFANILYDTWPKIENYDY